MKNFLKKSNKKGVASIMMSTGITLSFLGGVMLMPVVAQLPAETAVEKLGKGSTQLVLAFVVVALALGITNIFRIHRQDSMCAKQELRNEMERANKQLIAQMEKSQQIISDNTIAMNLMANSNTQLKEAITQLTHIIDKKVG